MFPAGKAYHRYLGRTRLVVLKSAVGFLFLLALSWGGSAQTCCSGGVPLGGSLALGSAKKNEYRYFLLMISFAAFYPDIDYKKMKSIKIIMYGFQTKVIGSQKWGVLCYITKQQIHLKYLQE